MSQQALYPLSYYMAELPPPADRARLAAAVLLELQSRFGVITDEEIASVAAAAHNEFAAARAAEQTTDTRGQPGMKVSRPGGMRNMILQANLRPLDQDLGIPEMEPLSANVMALTEQSLSRMQLD
ncbi:MAG: hypothetical protein VX259_09680, partial [Pseudomonadota bacterium]|nr:hypothetical protein [Pseudomonadota bacterium]